MGTNDLYRGGQRYRVQQVIGHESWNNPNMANDVGLVRIQGQIHFNERVAPIKYSTQFIDGGQRLDTAGWGFLYVTFPLILLTFFDSKSEKRGIKMNFSKNSIAKW